MTNWPTVGALLLISTKAAVTSALAAVISSSVIAVCLRVLPWPAAVAVPT
jgi:hypothetical protein